MKRIGNLYEGLLDRERIKDVIRLAAIGKKKRREVRETLEHIDERADEIVEMLRTGNFRREKPHNKTIKERGKERLLTISPFFPNRVLDYIMVETVKPYIKKSMYTYCIGNVDGRGISYGKRVIAKRYGKYKYHIKLDIRKFYPSVPSEALYEFAEKKIKDKRFLALCRFLILSNEGLPIGSYYSQWFSNWYLEDVDHAIKERLGVPFYVRYVDDMLLMGNNKKKLRSAMFGIEKMLREKGLQLKRHEQVKRTETEPVDFIGFRFGKSGVVMRRNGFSQLSRRVKHIRRTGHVCVSQARSLMARVGWIMQTDRGNGYYTRHVKPVVSMTKMRRIISGYDKTHRNHVRGLQKQRKVQPAV